eukprot:jgi/Hompol1/5863/HPOL_001117-RA
MAYSVSTALAATLVVILGASSGIGKHLALKYAARGAQLLLVARRKALLEQVQQECISLHPECRCEILAGDITDESVLALASATSNLKLGNGVDVLVICAGATSVLPFEDLLKLDSQSPASNPSPLLSLTTQIFQTNVFGPILAAKHFLPLLKQARGQLLVISSAAALISPPTRSLYASTKHALNGFFKSLRIEVAQYGISVCIAMPGTVDTDFRTNSLDQNQQKQLQSDQQPQQSRKRNMSPEECAAVILDGADYGDREIHLPRSYFWAHVASLFIPSIVDRFAANKYHYKL